MIMLVNHHIHQFALCSTDGEQYRQWISLVIAKEVEEKEKKKASMIRWRPRVGIMEHLPTSGFCSVPVSAAIQGSSSDAMTSPDDLSPTFTWQLEHSMKLVPIVPLNTLVLLMLHLGGTLNQRQLAQQHLLQGSATILT